MSSAISRLKVVKRVFWSCCLISGLASHAAFAQNYPNKPVEIIVPYSAGGSTDSTARLVAKGLSEQLHQPFLVVNRPGAGGQIAHAHVAQAAPDGYTLLFSAAGPLTVTPHSYSKLSYDPIKSFKAIKLVSAAPLLLIVNKKLKGNDLASLIKLAKSKPKELTYGSFGVGSAAHLAGELFKSLAQVDIVHVPYKGSAPALTDLMGGQIDMMFDVLVTALPPVKSGKAFPIAVTSSKRSSLVPDVPTIAEAGIEGFDAQTWFGLLGPEKIDANVVQKLSDALDIVLADPKFNKTILAQGMEVKGGTPQQFTSFFQSEYEKWGKVAKQSGITME
jgi:tripartite-type tricarboxylate transporter receptor subunit TctC